ncbi:hypothetical protein APU02_17520 [Citrobacter sp. 50677481]|nr:hypothetical protein APU02_17520 [Citrobacter sp. 50677481]
MFQLAHLPFQYDVILSTTTAGFLLPVTNNCKQYLFAMQKSDEVNILELPDRQICRAGRGDY